MTTDDLRRALARTPAGRRASLTLEPEHHPRPTTDRTVGDVVCWPCEESVCSTLEPADLERFIRAHARCRPPDAVTEW